MATPLHAATLEFVSAADDGWTTVPPEQAIEPRADLLLGWAEWHDLRERWPDDLRVGVVFPNDVDIRELLPSLPRLALVALPFPKWTDGRAYSQARLLRTRHRFRGQLRAIGDVIADMAAQLQRTGFDSAVLGAGESAAVARRMLTFFAEFYQADVNERRIHFDRTGVGANGGAAAPAANADMPQRASGAALASAWLRDLEQPAAGGMNRWAK